MAKNQQKGNVIALAEQLIAGTNKHLATLSEMKVASGSYTPSQVTAQLQAFATLRKDVDAAKASTKAKLAAEKVEMPARRTFLDAYVSFVKAAFSKSPDVLADFGLQPKKARASLTVEQKAAAAAKRKSTRAARHVMGSKQRKLVSGDVTGVVVTPVTAAKQPVTTTAPASPTAPATSMGGATGSTSHNG
jgi:hypothetical protein